MAENNGNTNGNGNGTKAVIHAIAIGAAAFVEPESCTRQVFRTPVAFG
jgi:hypothetical protein